MTTSGWMCRFVLSFLSQMRKETEQHPNETGLGENNMRIKVRDKAISVRKGVNGLSLF